MASSLESSTAPPTSVAPDPAASAFTSAGFIVLMVVASLSAILGAVYAYLYYTRINPHSHRARKYLEQPPGGVEEGGGRDGGNASTFTHLLLFRRS
jgi:hypothetical protein